MEESFFPDIVNNAVDAACVMKKLIFSYVFSVYEKCNEFDQSLSRLFDMDGRRDDPIALMENADGKIGKFKNGIKIKKAYLMESFVINPNVNSNSLLLADPLLNSDYEIFHHLKTDVMDYPKIDATVVAELNAVCDNILHVGPEFDSMEPKENVAVTECEPSIVNDPPLKLVGSPFELHLHRNLIPKTLDLPNACHQLCNLRLGYFGLMENQNCFDIPTAYLQLFDVRLGYVGLMENQNFFMKTEPFEMKLRESIIDENGNYATDFYFDLFGINSPHDAFENPPIVADILPCSSVNEHVLGKQFKPRELLLDSDPDGEWPHDEHKTLLEPLGCQRVFVNAIVVTFTDTLPQHISPFMLEADLLCNDAIFEYEHPSDNELKDELDLEQKHFDIDADTNVSHVIVTFGHIPDNDGTKWTDDLKTITAEVAMNSYFHPRCNFFDGSPGISFDKCVLKLKLSMLTDSLPLTNEQKVATLVLHLNGAAEREYFKMDSPDNQNFDSIVNHLKSKFPVKEMIKNAQMMLSKSFQETSESVHDFVNRIAELVHVICDGKPNDYVDDYLMRETLVRFRPELKIKVEFEDPQSYDALIRCASRCERFLADEKNLDQITNVMANNLNIDKARTCYVCHKKGHFAKECRQNRSSSSKHRHWSPDYRIQHHQPPPDYREHSPDFQEDYRNQPRPYSQNHRENPQSSRHPSHRESPPHSSCDSES